MLTRRKAKINTLIKAEWVWLHLEGMRRFSEPEWAGKITSTHEKTCNISTYLKASNKKNKTQIQGFQRTWLKMYGMAAIRF